MAIGRDWPPLAAWRLGRRWGRRRKTLESQVGRVLGGGADDPARPAARSRPVRRYNQTFTARGKHGRERRPSHMSTVLVVDDEAGARRTLMRLLAREGYDTVGAGDGNEALRTVQAKPPDVILLDLMMPGMDGLELLEALHAHPQWKALPVV